MPHLVAGEARHVPACFKKAENTAGEFLLIGTVMRPEVFDAHEDIIAADALRYAAHDFVAGYNGETTIGLQHDPDQEPEADLVESFVADADGSTYGYEFKKDDWVIVVRVNDPDLQARCADGTYNAFSPEGTARVQYLDEGFTKAEGSEPKRRKKRYLSMYVQKVDIVDHGANRLDYVTILKRQQMDTQTTAPEQTDTSESQTEAPPSGNEEPVTKSEVDSPTPTPEPEVVREPESEVTVRKERRMTQGRRDEIRSVIGEAREAAGKIGVLADRLQAMLDEVEQSTDSDAGELGDNVNSDTNTSSSPGFEEIVSKRFAEFQKTIEDRLTAAQAGATELQKTIADRDSRIAAQDAEIQDLRKRLSEASLVRPASSRVEGTTVETRKSSQDAAPTSSVFAGIV